MRIVRNQFWVIINVTSDCLNEFEKHCAEPRTSQRIGKMQDKNCCKKGEKTDNIYSFWKIEISPF